jgi:hypothetical protein
MGSNRVFGRQTQRGHRVELCTRRLEDRSVFLSHGGQLDIVFAIDGREVQDGQVDIALEGNNGPPIGNHKINSGICK